MVRDLYDTYRLLDSWNRGSSRRFTFRVLGPLHIRKRQYDASDVFSLYTSLPDSKSMALSTFSGGRFRFGRRVLALVFDDTADYAQRFT